MSSGALVALIGVSVVFLALVTLVVIVSITSRLLAPRKRVARASEPAAPGVETALATETPAEAKGLLEAIALAAYAYHRRRRSRIRTAPAPTQWEIAGRVRQLARSDYGN